MAYYDEYMIDIETLATTPEAVVLSIGAVKFSQDEGVTDTFVVKLDLHQQVRARRYMDPDTLSWWMSQNNEARHAAFSSTDREKVRTALENLGAFLGVNQLAVWANSPSFDLVILESLYRSAKMNTPWHYSLSRDLRTLRDMAELPSSWEPDSEVYNFVDHDPLSDCVWQVEVVRECRRLIGPVVQR